LRILERREFTPFKVARIEFELKASDLAEKELLLRTYVLERLDPHGEGAAIWPRFDDGDGRSPRIEKSTGVPGGQQVK
jgi:hypothetical protein